MSVRPNSCPFTIDDMEAGAEILKAPLGYCPQIDQETRLILRALLDDMFNHLHAWHDPEQCEDAWASAQFMHDILSDILNRTPENTKIPDTLEWLRTPIEATPTTEKEDNAMSFEEIDLMLKELYQLDLDSLDKDVLEHLEEQLKLMLDLVQQRTGN